MPRYKLSWTEETLWEVEIEARDKLQARQKFDDWDSDVSDHCYEVESLNIGGLEIEVVRRTRNNANINSVD